MAADLPLSALRPLERRAMILVLAGLLYNSVEFAVAEIAGVMAGSVALIGFGFDSAIEISASVIVLVHLLQRNGEEESAWEGRIAVYVGVTLIALSSFVGAKAVYDLVTVSRPDESYVGIVLAAASLCLMPLISGLKHGLAHKINSRALEAESRETLVCSWLSGALLLGLSANALFGWWWADPAAALVIVAVMLREGWEAVTRKELCCAD
jgi:divalent metal cation (Fe/Co/Zn/Cd) transporter